MDLGGGGGWPGSRTVPVLSPPHLCNFDLALANDTAGKRQGAHTNHRPVRWQPIPCFRSEHDWTVHKYSGSSFFWLSPTVEWQKNCFHQHSNAILLKSTPAQKNSICANTHAHSMTRRWRDCEKEGPRLSKHTQKFNEGSTERPDHLWSDTKSLDEMKLTSVGHNQAVRIIFFNSNPKCDNFIFLNFPMSFKSRWLFFVFGFYWVELNHFVPCNFQFLVWIYSFPLWFYFFLNFHFWLIE